MKREKAGKGEKDICPGSDAGGSSDIISDRDFLYMDL